MTRAIPLIAAALLAAPPVFAQPTAAPTESVTVTATKLQDEIHAFVQGYAAPSPAIGKLARWRNGVCPTVAGLAPALAAKIVRRAKEIAVMAGAPVGADNCDANIDIVFSASPQLLLDNVRAHHPGLLGYHDVSQEAALARVTHPVQAWYATETADFYNRRDVDNKESMDQVVIPGAFGSLRLLGVRVEKVTGNHMDDGLHSELFHVIVTINTGRVRGDTIGPLSDYAAMLALAPTTTFGTCPDLPSVTGVVTNDCANKSPNITWTDLAFLRALYKTDSTRSLAQQRRDIAEDMGKTLSSR